jgi:hypothetical protein
MKLTSSIILAMIIASSDAAFGADATALWAQNCAFCQGNDGSGNTTMGKKLGVKDYTKEQAFGDADVKALVTYVRSLKK